MLNCKVRCIGKGDGRVATKGNVYEFINGFFILDNGDTSCCYDNLDQFNERNHHYKMELIVENYTTLEMMNLAEKNGKTYIIDSLAYNKKEGFHNYQRKVEWRGNTFCWLNDLVRLDSWTEIEDIKEMTIYDIQEELGYKIKIVE